MTSEECRIWNNAIDHAMDAVARTTDGADPRLWDAMERLKRDDGQAGIITAKGGDGDGPQRPWPGTGGGRRRF